MGTCGHSKLSVCRSASEHARASGKGRLGCYGRCEGPSKKSGQSVSRVSRLRGGVPDPAIAFCRGSSRKQKGGNWRDQAGEREGGCVFLPQAFQIAMGSTWLRCLERISGNASFRDVENDSLNLAL